MHITLPAPCPICEGPVTYSGRGRRPDYCSTACKNVQRAEDARNRRARESRTVAPVDPLIRALAERRSQRVAAAGRVEVRRAVGDNVEHVGRLAEEAFGEGAERFDLGAAGYVPESADKGTWAERTSTARHRDPAAVWLAAHHPEVLADFPAATHVGRTVS
ncbi:hypothetical protein ACLQ3H_00360 [Micromonospora saelicesensis]|uniref:hypothetical protein n=1 Tax=Micromonospora saelicesensis TaxID=285676 RepID=UPI003CEDA6B2